MTSIGKFTPTTLAKAGFTRSPIKRPSISAPAVVKIQSVEANAYLRLLRGLTVTYFFSSNDFPSLFEHTSAVRALRVVAYLHIHLQHLPPPRFSDDEDEVFLSQPYNLFTHFYIIF